MAFLNDKVLRGEHVTLRHVTEDDAEAILEAWPRLSRQVSSLEEALDIFIARYAKPFPGIHAWRERRMAEIAVAGTLWDDARALVARQLARVADDLHPSAKVTIQGARVSSTWRHHRPPSLDEERHILRRLEKDEDRYQYLMTHNESGEIIGCIGFKTNRSQKDGHTDDPLENLRVAKLGMLLFREDPWDHHCEREAIRLVLEAIFRQEFRRRDGTRFRIMDVVIPVNTEDTVTYRVLTDLGFQHAVRSYPYHGRVTHILEYFPLDLDPKAC